MDGNRAFDIFETYNSDIIIMDMDLRLMNGLELISKIREAHSLIDNYIIVVSGNGEDSDESLALKLGANNYISKPVRPVKLLSLFTTAVEAIHAVIELKFENYLLQQNSFRDVLTGLVNKDYLYRRCREEEFKARRYKRSLSCMQFKFDGFDNLSSGVDVKIQEDIIKESAAVFKESLRKL